jgi:general secretion pathway protein K
MMKQRGVALLLVLWMLIILIGIIGVFALISRTEMQQGKYLSRGVQTRYAAESGVEIAALRLSQNDPLLRWMPDNRPYTFQIDKTRHEVRVLDESGKVDINVAGADVLIPLFRALELSQVDAESLSSAILDWRDADDLLSLPGGAEDPQYASAGRPYGARDNAFQTITEVQQVLGMTPDIYQRLAPLITIYSGLARPNPSFAPGPVLAAMGYLPPQIAQLIAQREAWQPGTPEFTLPDGNPLATSGSRAEVLAIVRVGANGNFGQMYTPLAWRVGDND